MRKSLPPPVARTVPRTGQITGGDGGGAELGPCRLRLREPRLLQATRPRCAGKHTPHLPHTCWVTCFAQLRPGAARRYNFE
eukprot:6185488-Pleurochrysis_carterae.AAC.3